MNRVIVDLFVRSMSEPISYEFLLRIYVWAELIRVLMHQKAVAQMWLRGCKRRPGCPNIDLRRIKAITEPDTDPSHMESPDVLATFSRLFNKNMKQNIYLWIIMLWQQKS